MNLAMKTELESAVSSQISRFPSKAPAPVTQDNRKYRRVAMRLTGHCTFEDFSEHEVQTINVSQGGAALSCAISPKIGTIVVLKLASLGRIHSKVVRALFGTFAVEFEISSFKRSLLGEEIKRLEAQATEQPVDARRFERIDPIRRDAMLTCGSEQFVVKIINLSRSGAAIQTDLDLPVDTVIKLGADVTGRVARTFIGGIGMEFFRPLPAARFDENITFVID